MEFRKQGRPLSDEGIHQTCSVLGVTPPAVWAVLSVETSGFGFFPDRRPRILFERHHFRRFTNARFDQNPDISCERPGGYTIGAREYGRLQKAMAFDEDAALKSASWGVGQVMGSNFVVAGFPSVRAMVSEMVRDENAQLLAMASFIKGNGLHDAMQDGDWRTFARGYNGKDFEKNEYDTRLAAAHAKYRMALPNLRLRAAQAALLYLGFEPGAIDGVKGRFTRSALARFQAIAHLPDTGELDPETEHLLTIQAFEADVVI